MFLQITFQRISSQVYNHSTLFFQCRIAALRVHFLMTLFVARVLLHKYGQLVLCFEISVMNKPNEGQITIRKVSRNSDNARKRINFTKSYTALQSQQKTLQVRPRILMCLLMKFSSQVNIVSNAQEMRIVPQIHDSNKLNVAITVCSSTNPNSSFYLVLEKSAAKQVIKSEFRL